MTGYSRFWIYQIVRHYNEQGFDAIADQPHQNPGDEQQAQLSRVLQYPAPDGGLWNEYAWAMKNNISSRKQRMSSVCNNISIKGK